jgi:hypothetical protein
MLQSLKDRPKGQLTVSDSDLTWWKNLVDSEWNHYHCDTKQLYKWIYEWDVVVIWELEEKKYILAWKSVWYNNQEILWDNIDAAKNIKDTPYVLYTYNNSLMLYNDGKTINIPNMAIEDNVDESSLNEWDKKFYNDLKKQYASVLLFKNKDWMIKFIIADEWSNSVYTASLIDNQSSLYIREGITKHFAGGLSSIVDITTWKDIISNVKIEEVGGVKFYESHNKEYMLVNGELLWGWSERGWWKCKVYQPVHLNQPTIIFREWGYPKSYSLYVIEKWQKLWIFKEMQCYITPYDNHYVVKNDDWTYSLFDAKNNNMVSKKYDNYHENTNKLYTKRKWLLSPTKSIIITKKGIIKW